MTLYDFNKFQYSQLPDMTKVEKEKAIETIRDFITKEPNTYYVMLNYDTHYFTIFVWNNDPYGFTLANEIFSTAKSIGKIKAVEINKDILEIWIKQEKQECCMYGLIRYDKGVITV